MPDHTLTILYRDDYLIAVNKPARLLVHRSALDRHETSNALKLLRDQTGCYLYPVHRLDKPTSGVLLFALNKDTARYLSRLFEEHRVVKHYTAVVRGYCIESGEVDHAIRDRDSKHKARVPATTSYSNLATIELPVSVDRYPTSRYSILNIQPLSGRRHQIRMHMKHINHPIIGDTSYGKKVHNSFFSECFNCTRLLLHAQSIQLDHPDSSKPLVISAPIVNAEFARVINDTRWCWQNQQDKLQLMSE
ncbi:hypothetical protein AB833_22650 [Chromatiales bacterium (ex Bugula neritina AB1)]|nr:hypothetical protein AB833_22650 [Chromatiales bacterium (ex Bugula neritina AB1)]